jgi:uncharacterized protein
MAVDPFVVHVARLRRTLGTRWHEVRQGPFDPLDQIAPRTSVDSAVLGGQDASCDLFLESIPGGVVVTGSVSAPWHGVCRRCTKDVGGVLSVPVRERFVTAASGQSGALEDELAYPIVEDELDLGPMVRELITLELPLAPLCREDCQGLCPHCGIDRNEESCDCVAPRDLRWANLDVLRSSSMGS